MKAAPFDYVAPATIAEACSHLADAGGGAQVIAGGQTLMPLLALRMSMPFILVDIGRTEGLRGITRTAEGVRIGAMTRQNEIIASEELATALPVLVQATRHVGHHQTRNRGTIGGSIALGEPAAELPATAVALGASVEVHSTRGQRRVPVDELYVGPYATVLESDELITAIHFPAWPSDTVTLFREVAMRPGDFALVGLVGALVLDQGRISRAGIAWFGMGPTPVKARQAEAALTGQRIADLDFAHIADLALADTSPFDGAHATADYRRSVGRRVFARALREALEERQKA